MLLAKAKNLPLITSDNEEADSDDHSSSESSDGGETPPPAVQPATTGGTPPAKAKARVRALEAPRNARGSKMVHTTDLPDPSHNRGSPRRTSATS